MIDGDSAYHGTMMMILPVTKVPEVVRKLRLRNFPSVVLFKDGKKVRVWKADFDGNLDLTTEQVRKVVSWHATGKVYYMKDFFNGLYWVIFLLILIIIVGILGQFNGGDMNMYLKAMRINNG